MISEEAAFEWYGISRAFFPEFFNLDAAEECCFMMDSTNNIEEKEGLFKASSYRLVPDTKATMHIRNIPNFLMWTAFTQYPSYITEYKFLCPLPTMLPRWCDSAELRHFAWCGVNALLNKDMVRQHVLVDKQENKCYMFASLPLMKMPHWTKSFNMVVPFKSWMLMQDCGMYEMALCHIDHCCDPTYMSVIHNAVVDLRTRANPHYVKEVVELPETQENSQASIARAAKTAKDVEDALQDNSHFDSLYSKGTE
jgi:hypothetical protein